MDCCFACIYVCAQTNAMGRLWILNCTKLNWAWKSALLFWEWLCSFLKRVQDRGQGFGVKVLVRQAWGFEFKTSIAGRAGGSLALLTGCWPSLICRFQETLSQETEEVNAWSLRSNTWGLRMTSGHMNTHMCAHTSLHPKKSLNFSYCVLESNTSGRAGWQSFMD